MPLVTSKEMLLKAQKGGYAVGAFNAENMEMVKAIIQAAEELKAPVMIQTTPSTIKYGTVETYAAIVAAEAAKASVPVCLHLDHGSSFEQRNKSACQCQTLCLHYRSLHLCQNTCVKVFAQSYFLLNLLIYKQVLIAEQMSRYVFPGEEVTQHRFLLNRSFALPVSLKELFYILIIHIRQFLNTFVLPFVWP